MTNPSKLVQTAKLEICDTSLRVAAKEQNAP
jgi:hypothetical protein